MPEPDLPVVAEGQTSHGVRWYLKAGGSSDDYYTMLETVHPDGHRDEGGMGGSALYPGSLLNAYTGRADAGPLRVIVRADPQVRRLHLRSAQAESCDLLPVGDDPAAGVTFFAALLPWTTGPVSVQAFDADGRPLSEQDLRRRGIEPGMTPPGSQQGPRAVVVPRTE